MLLNGETASSAEGRLLGSADDDFSSSLTDSQQLLNTLYINLFFFALFVALFEAARLMKSIFQNRLLKRKIVRENRVPPSPPTHPFGWLWSIHQISDNEVLRMVGLDGYMFLKFIKVCLRTAVFISSWGLVILVPVYYTASENEREWNKYTIANISDNQTNHKLICPVIFCYLFAAFFCHQMQSLYKKFILKRVDYLLRGDKDTHPQTYYTVMVERIPSTIRALPLLVAFFERIFPGKVYSVEVALELDELSALCAKRRNVRNRLEKAVALMYANTSRPTTWVKIGTYTAADEPHPTAVVGSEVANKLGYEILDSIEHYTAQLKKMNASVRELQKRYFDQRQRLDVLQESRVLELQKAAHIRARSIVDFVADHSSRILHTSEGDRKRDGARASPGAGAGVGVGAGDRERGASSLVIGEVPASVRIPVSMAAEAKSERGDAAVGALGEVRASPASAVAAVAGPDGVSRRVERRDHQNDNDREHVLSAAQQQYLPPIHETKPAVMAAVEWDISSETSSPLFEEGATKIPLHNIPGSSAAAAAAAAVAGSKRERADRRSLTSDEGSYGSSETHGRSSTAGTGADAAKAVAHFVSDAAISGVEGLAKQGMRNAEFATRGALRGVVEATRTIELLTLGANYKISSTAFVTFTSRVAASSAHQMLLSHDHFHMAVEPAPNPKDILWENVSIPHKQIKSRRVIADIGIALGALFWSSVVTFIVAAANLESISQQVKWLQQYSDTILYKFVNSYLAIVLLLILLSILPFIFDSISRYYTGLKQESEIQNSIMTRYFYYQLANVYVSVGLGSVANSINAIIDSPTSILSILGSSVPSFSIYFANFMIVKTLTAIPLEMLRVIPLLQIMGVRMCIDKKKCTRRDLRNGAFADPPMLYGWCYPNILMVVMIMFVYCCIAPFLMPFCAFFFCLAYLMYKYQLLYVYINEYQSGGFMWYAVFNRSMLALLCGVLTLVCYLAIRMTFMSGPLYLLLPLPVLIVIFWHYCETNYREPTLNLSLESAMDIDHATEIARNNGLPTAHTFFSKSRFRQPDLAEGKLKPAPYRRERQSEVNVLSLKQQRQQQEQQEELVAQKRQKPGPGGIGGKPVALKRDASMATSRSTAYSDGEREELAEWQEWEEEEEEDARERRRLERAEGRAGRGMDGDREEGSEGEGYYVDDDQEAEDEYEKELEVDMELSRGVGENDASGNRELVRSSRSGSGPPPPQQQQQLQLQQQQVDVEAANFVCLHSDLETKLIE